MGRSRGEDCYYDVFALQETHVKIEDIGQLELRLSGLGLRCLPIRHAA